MAKTAKKLRRRLPRKACEARDEAGGRENPGARACTGQESGAAAPAPVVVDKERFTLYGMLGSARPTRWPHASLSKAPFSYIHINLREAQHKQPDYLVKNRYGQVPALRDGQTYYVQSAAILEHLAETLHKFEGKTEFEKNRIREWLFWQWDKLSVPVFRLRARARASASSATRSAFFTIRRRGRHSLFSRTNSERTSGWRASVPPSRRRRLMAYCAMRGSEYRPERLSQRLVGGRNALRHCRALVHPSRSCRWRAGFSKGRSQFERSGCQPGDGLRSAGCPAAEEETPSQRLAGMQAWLLLGVLGLVASRLGQLWIAFDVSRTVHLAFRSRRVAFLIGLLMPRAKLLSAFLVLVLGIVCIGSWPHVVSRVASGVAAAGAGEITLKVASFNTLYDNDNADAVQAEILRIDADVITLIEMGPNKRRIIEAVKERYPHHAACYEIDFCNLVVLSKVPVVDTDAQAIWMVRPISAPSWARSG